MDDPLLEMSNHLDDVHAQELAKAWRRYCWLSWTLALVGLVGWSCFVLSFTVDFRFFAAFALLGGGVMWLTPQVHRARQTWVKLFDWGEDGR